MLGAVTYPRRESRVRVLSMYQRAGQYVIHGHGPIMLGGPRKRCGRLLPRERVPRVAGRPHTHYIRLVPKSDAVCPWFIVGVKVVMTSPADMAEAEQVADLMVVGPELHC